MCRTFQFGNTITAKRQDKIQPHRYTGSWKSSSDNQAFLATRRYLAYLSACIYYDFMLITVSPDYLHVQLSSNSNSSHLLLKKLSGKVAINLIISTLYLKRRYLLVCVVNNQPTSSLFANIRDPLLN